MKRSLRSADHDEPAAHASDPVQARRKAMDYLARREHGSDELQKKLVTAGFAPDTAKIAVEQLAREGLQDDGRFVEGFVQSRINQGKGPVRIRVELAQHGIEGGVVDDCLQAMSRSWAELARSVRLKKFGAGAPGDFREKARQMRFLQYRGFESDDIQQALAGDDDG